MASANYHYGSNQQKNSRINYPLLVNEKELEGKFTCGVCHSILENPHNPDICNHTFCKQCLFNCFAQNKSCPMCRKQYEYRRIRFNHEIGDQLVTRKYICVNCDQKVRLCDLNQHNLTCDDTVTPKVKSSLHSLNTSISSNNSLSTTSSSSISMTSYNCPYCSTKNLDFNSLRNHCNQLHKDGEKEKVCPICASMPWGDKNQKSIDFIQHLNFRHRFEYENFLNYDGDEELMEQQVLLDICRENLKNKKLMPIKQK